MPCKGVCCGSDNKTVISLDLAANNLAGALPTTLFSGLHGLKSISLENNKLSGIPDAICNLLINERAMFCDFSLNPFGGNHCPPCIAGYCKIPDNTTCSGGGAAGTATDAGRAGMFVLVLLLVMLQFLFCGCCCCCLMWTCISRAKAKLDIDLHNARASSAREERLLNSSGSNHNDAFLSSSVSFERRAAKSQRVFVGIIAVALLALLLCVFVGILVVGIVILFEFTNGDGGDSGESEEGDPDTPSRLQVAMCVFGALKLKNEATKNCAELFTAWHFAVLAALLYELVSVPLHAGRLTHQEGMPYPAALWHAFTHQFWCCTKRKQHAIGDDGSNEMTYRERRSLVQLVPNGDEEVQPWEDERSSSETFAASMSAAEEEVPVSDIPQGGDAEDEVGDIVEASTRIGRRSSSSTMTTLITEAMASVEGLS